MIKKINKLNFGIEANMGLGLGIGAPGSIKRPRQSQAR